MPLSSIPGPWILLAESSSGPLYQAVFYCFATGDESEQTTEVEWTSVDPNNDAITGRIHQFRYVDPDQPWQGLTSPILGDLNSINLPTVVTTERNTLATYWVSWSDNVMTNSPTGAIGGVWQNIGDIVSASTADDLANRRAGAQMVEPGTISGGTIKTTPTP